MPVAARRHALTSMEAYELAGPGQRLAVYRMEDSHGEPIVKLLGPLSKPQAVEICWLWVGTRAPCPRHSWRLVQASLTEYEQASLPHLLCDECYVFQIGGYFVEPVGSTNNHHTVTFRGKFMASLSRDLAASEIKDGIGYILLGVA